MTQAPNSSSITRRLQVVFAASILLLIFSSLASFLSNRQLISSSKWVNHTNEVINTTENLLSGIRSAEAAQRGYLLTNDRQFLDPYTGAHERAVERVSVLRELTNDNPQQQLRMDTLKALVGERFRQMRLVLDRSSSISPEERAQVFANSHEEITVGNNIMTELRGVIDRIRNSERVLLETRLHEQERYTTWTPYIVVLAALIAIAISLLAYFRVKSDLDERVRKQLEEQERFEETNRRIAAIENFTQDVSKGNYSARSGDTADDELGRISRALNGMVASLEQTIADLDEKAWQTSGSASLSEAVRGERLVRAVCSKIVANTAQYLNAAVGTLYVADEQLHLRLQASFAASRVPEYIAPGEGLAGQALQGREPLVTEALPKGYLRVSSSLGETGSLYAMIVPLIAAGRAIGVLELGFFRKPDERQLEYIRTNAEAMGISINAALIYERTQELLEETQAQSEELQAQHNELENINAELEMQAEKLQASEEELRVQQEELQQANLELEERSRMLEERNITISDQNTEVRRQAEELATSARYKSEFLANMSHELRTPLNSILLLSRLLAENNENTLTDEQTEYARVIQSSGHGLLTLIDEILDLSKIEAGKMELEYAAVSLQEVANDMHSLFEPVARERNLELKLDVDNGNRRLETDKQRLEQILKNLLSNALKFTSEGSVSLTMRQDLADDHMISFEVKDTGIGIPEAKQALIFEAFQQADGSTRRRFGGTGLGLSISKELARLLGGSIRVRSVEGQGSTFTLTIPDSETSRNTIESPEQPSAEVLDLPAPAKEILPGFPDAASFTVPMIPESIPDDRADIKPGDRNILIVEDDVYFAKSLLGFTRQRGYKGLVAVRGDEGIELARQYRPTGILLDIQLPIKSGWQVMEELKSDPLTRHIPVHIMSSMHVRKESLLRGAVNFIDKPVAMEQMQEIFSKIEYVLNRDAKKVLIVEENPKHARALAYFLEQFNIASDIKNTVSDSVTALQSDTDCVILDMGIPNGRAYETLEEIKKTPGLEQLPIIVFTGKSLSMAEEQRIRQYADSIVVKTAHSYQRILDEVSLFLHLMEESKKPAQKDGFRKLGALSEVLRDKTVLIVDDDVRNIFSLTKALEAVNMKVVTAIDGKEAIQQLKEHPDVSVVLLDMMMPQMDGYETARRIRQNDGWKRLPVIAVTAKAMTGDREKCIQAGASDYITKPIDIDQLLSLLRVWLYERGMPFKPAVR
jgi:signal transduction histidine kinase/DNA-binding response OmpR family regulator/CHASE3 domain sensor protein